MILSAFIIVVGIGLFIMGIGFAARNCQDQYGFCDFPYDEWKKNNV